MDAIRVSTTAPGTSFLGPRREDMEEKASSCWRRLFEAAKRQDINVSEFVEIWGNEGPYISYSEFMRGLVSILGSGCRQFSHSERKKLFDSLKPNRDGFIEIENIRKMLKNLDKQIVSTSPTSSTCASPNSLSLPQLLQTNSITTTREAALRYRRDRLVSANLVLRAALLDKRPLLCCRLADNAKAHVVAESTLVLEQSKIELSATLIWDHQIPNTSICNELSLACIATVYGISGTIISYGDTHETNSSLFFRVDNGLLWTALRYIIAEITALRHLADSNTSFQMPTVQLRCDNKEWIQLSTCELSITEKQALASKTTKSAQLRVLLNQQSYGEIGFISVATEQVSCIDIDNHQAWFVRPETGSLSSVFTRMRATNAKDEEKKALSHFALQHREAENNFVYVITHVAQTESAIINQLTTLAHQRRVVCPNAHLPSPNTFESRLPLDILRQRRALCQQEKQQHTAEEAHCQHGDSSGSINNILRDCFRRLEQLDDHEQSTSLLSNNHLTQASRRQRLISWERASRLQAALGRIQTICRIRPLLPEIDDKLGPPPEVRLRLKGKINFVHRTGSKGRHVALELDGHKLPNKCRTFEFDEVWDEETSQDEVFESVENLTNDVLAGRTASVFAYGCTGGGKSYTVVGDLRSEPPRLGIAFQSVELLLATLRGKGKKLRLSMVEVHNEEIYDLLKPQDAIVDVMDLNTPRNSIASSIFDHADSPSINSKHLSFQDEVISVQDSEESFGSHSTLRLSTPNYIRNSPKGNSRRDSDPRKRIGHSSWTSKHNHKKKLEIRLNGDVPQLSEITKVDIDSMAIFVKIFETGNRRRVTKSTLLNAHSSRSHVILMCETASGGRLCMVDLAGCERVDKSGAHGDALKEATCINKSLSALGDCFEAIDHKRSHIPYRNSKLSFLLSDIIGGPASRCLFCFAASPAWATLPETLSSFKFAARMSTIQLSGEALSEKQKHTDACLAVAGERSERILLTTFLSELQVEEEEALRKATKRAIAKTAQATAAAALLRQANKSESEKEEHSENEATSDSTILKQKEDEVHPLPPEEVLMDEVLPSESNESFEQPNSPLSSQSQRDQHVEQEIKMLWNRLRATETELAALKEVERPATLESDGTLLISSKLCKKHLESGIHDDESDDDDEIEQELVSPSSPSNVAILSVIEVHQKKETKRPKDIDVELIVPDDMVPRDSGCGVAFFHSVFGIDEDDEAGHQAVIPRPPISQSSGHKLVLSIHQAEGLSPDTSLGGGLMRCPTNPYVIVRYGDEEQVTRQDMDTLSPCWEADLIFNYVEQNLTFATLYLFSTNSFTPDSLLGKCVLNFRKPNIDKDAEEKSSTKPQLLLERSWLPIVPCEEQERHLIRHFDQESTFSIKYRHPRYLYKKGKSLGMIEVTAYSFLLGPDLLF